VDPVLPAPIPVVAPDVTVAPVVAAPDGELSGCVVEPAVIPDVFSSSISPTTLESEGTPASAGGPTEVAAAGPDLQSPSEPPTGTEASAKEDGSAKEETSGDVGTRPEAPMAAASAVVAFKGPERAPPPAADARGHGPAPVRPTTADAGRPIAVTPWWRRLGPMAIVAGRLAGKVAVVLGRVLWLVSIALARLTWKVSVALGRLIWKSLVVLGHASASRIKHWKNPRAAPRVAGAGLAAVWRDFARAPDGSPLWLRVCMTAVGLGRATAATVLLWGRVIALTVVGLKDTWLGRVGCRWAAWCMETRLGRAIRCRVRNWIRSMKGLMTEGEIALMDGARGGRTPICLMRTDSRVDVGQWCNPWWGGARVWIAVVGAEVVMIAEGKRPFVERIPIADLPESHYNPVTGELVLAKVVVEWVRKIRLPPVEGRQVLGYMTGKGETLCWK
jgi:hypothetical protein